MREFVLYSRKGRTDGDFKTLKEAGRLDTVYQCILTSIFKSHAHRPGVVFHAVLGGPPRPPLRIRIDGDTLRDVRVDERSWEAILRSVLRGKAHPGISVDVMSIQGLVKRKHADGYKIYVLEEKGEDISECDLSGDILVVLGDHIGLPKKDEKFLLRFGRKMSLGRETYLAASCIDIVNYVIDRSVEH